MGSLGNWRPIANALAAQHAVVLVDLRNHGASFHQAPHSLVAMTEDVLALADTLGVARFQLIGHSMGGKVAFELSKHAAHRVSRMVVVDISSRGYNPATNTQLLSSLAKVPLTGLYTRTHLDKAFEKVLPESSMRAFMLKNLKHKAEGGFAWLPNLDLLARSTADYMCEVVFESGNDLPPLLLIQGKHSAYLQESDVSLLQNTFDDFQLKTLDTGHWPHSEAPEAFLRAVQPFLGPQ